MSRQLYDPSSKWMLEEQGTSILYLAGERNVLSCRARKAEIVQPPRRKESHDRVSSHSRDR